MKSGEGVQRVDDELAPVMNGGDGVVDGVQKGTVTLISLSAMTFASRGDGER
jgi:hypothetical protein